MRSCMRAILMAQTHSHYESMIHELILPRSKTYTLLSILPLLVGITLTLSSVALIDIFFLKISIIVIYRLGFIRNYYTGYV